MNVVLQNPTELIQNAMEQHETIYNELLEKFYSPIQYALEGKNSQTLQTLREQWTSGTIPEQDEFAIEIQSLRNTVEQYQEDPSLQNEVADLDKRVSQLESMHNEITNDLQVANQQNTLNGGRRNRSRSRSRNRSRKGNHKGKSRKSRKVSKKSKKAAKPTRRN